MKPSRKEQKPAPQSTSAPFVIEDGDGREISVDMIPPRVRKVMAYLDGFEVGKAIQTGTLSDRVGLAVENFREHRALRKYRTLFHNKLYWGNPKTFEQLHENKT